LDDMPLSALIGVLLILILFSAFFSGSETALMTLNRYRLRHLRDSGHAGAKRASLLLERPDRLIGLILLGNNFVNILASSLATVIALRLGGEGAIAIAAGILTLVILIFSEVTPKTLAALHPERIAFPAAYVYVPLLKLLYPLVWVVNLIANALLRRIGVSPEDSGEQSLSKEELRTVLLEAGAMIPERSRNMLLGILDLEHACVEDIMIPRHEVAGVDLQDSLEDIVEIIRKAPYTVLLLFDGSIDNLIGMLHARNAMQALLDGELSKDTLRRIAHQPYFIPEGTLLYQQLVRFQREKRRTGLVVDEYGDFQGLLTLSDLLEQIVGEFTTDPADIATFVHPQQDGSILIDGNASVREINRKMHWNLPTDGPKTLNGLILEYLEAIPETGTSLKLHGYPLEIIHTAEHTVRTVRYWKKTPHAAPTRP
jgi:Mg2+/Co2+ transporter CorB